MPFAGFDDWDDCIQTMTEEEGHDQQSAENICGALQAEAKSDLGDVDQLREAIGMGAGLIADVGVDLVSGVDVPAVDSKWVMTKSADATDGHDYRARSPLLLAKADDSDGDKRLSYAAAMIPREPDKEGDVVATPTVEKAAHGFLKADGGVDTDHSLIDGEGEVVESWVLKEERTFDLPGGATETYAAGTWMVGIEWGQDAWQRIKSGDLTGLSIYGQAEHVPLERAASCGCGTATAKQLDIPLANESVVHLVYESRTAAEKASEEIGLDGAVHEHEFDGMTVFMPGATHEAFVDRYMELSDAAESTTASKQPADDPCWDGYEMVGTKTDEFGNEVPNCVPVEAASAETGDTDKGGEGKSAGMAQDSAGDGSDDGGGPDIETVAASVDDLADTVDTLKETIETEKQDMDEAAAAIGDQYDLGAGDVLDIIAAASNEDPSAVLDAINSLSDGGDGEVEADAGEKGDGDEGETAETETAEKRVDGANLGKGGDGTATAQKGVTDDGGSGDTSWAAAKEKYAGEN